MRAYRSSALRMASRHCPAVLDHLDNGTPYERRGFEVGVAAHAVLQAVGEATNTADRALVDAEIDRVAGEVAARLIGSGRSFDGTPEPPMVADNAWHGRDLALSWLRFHPVEPGAYYETPLAASATWEAVPYASGLARYRGILDERRITEDGDEEQGWQTVVVRDHKSAWSEGEEWLDSLQARGYAVLAWVHHPAAKVIRLELAHLRLCKLWTREIQVDEEGAALLRQWRDDLTQTMGALDAPEARAATPGVGCAGCPFLGRCDAARAYYAGGDIPETGEARAVAYAVLEALRERMAGLLKEDTAEAPLAIPGGVVGTVGRRQRCATVDAPGVLWEAWQAQRGDALGLLYRLGLGVKAIESVAKYLYPERGDKPLREDLVDQCTGVEIARRFGVWPNKEDAA